MLLTVVVVTVEAHEDLFIFGVSDFHAIVVGGVHGLEGIKLAEDLESEDGIFEDLGTADDLRGAHVPTLVGKVKDVVGDHDKSKGIKDEEGD